MKLRQLFAVCWARRALVACILLAVVGGTALYSLLKSKTYVGETSVLVDAKNTDPVTGNALPQQLQSTVQATQGDVIASHAVARKVVDRLRLAADPAAQQEFSQDGEATGAIEDWVAERLLKKLTVRSTRDSNVINIDVEAATPLAAARIANAFADAYVQTTLELRTDPAKRQNQWFDDQVQALRTSLQTAQQRLSQYQQQRKIVGTDDKLDVETAKLNEIASQLVTAQTAMNDADSRQRQMNQALQKHQLEELPDILGNSLLQNMKAELMRAEGKLAQIGQRYGKNHPENVSAAAEVQTLRNKLSAEVATVKGSIDQSAQLARQRAAEEQKALDAQKHKILELRQQRDGLDVLNREVESAQRAYDAAMQRNSELSLTSRLNQTNIAILTVATPPAKAASPKFTRNVILAFIAGTLLAAGATLALELFDRRVRAGADLLELPGGGTLPVLAEIRGLSLSKPARSGRPVRQATVVATLRPATDAQ
ncbi:MAG: chain length determinant protein EpsF [Proteobacteria bacterium]|nr:chain length determinant protein EpsF [Pseudomonadota bacterium]